jgi:hypothetical protein
MNSMHPEHSQIFLSNGLHTPMDTNCLLLSLPCYLNLLIHGVKTEHASKLPYCPVPLLSSAFTLLSQDLFFENYKALFPLLSSMSVVGPDFGTRALIPSPQLT